MTTLPRLEPSSRAASNLERSVGLDEARRTALSRFSTLAPIAVPISHAGTRVLAETIRARENVPSFANSAMDGFAIVASDVASGPTRLSVVVEVMAGDRRSLHIGPGSAARIMTGAPLPDGADAVVPIEQAPDHDFTSVRIDRPAVPGANVRYPGEDVRIGDEVLFAGCALGAASIGVLASLGIENVSVHPSPVVGVLSTGDEVVDGASDPGPGRIRDANRPALIAAIRSEGGEAIDLGIVGDDEAAVAAAIRSAEGRCDAVVVSAGVSFGDRDFVGEVLEKECRGNVDRLLVRLRPGKPLTVGNLERTATPVVCLPGNPVAAMVGFELFVRPGLRRLAGHSQLERPLVSATADAPYARRLDGKVHVCPVKICMAPDHTVHVFGWGERGSHQLRSFATCDALAIVPDGMGVAVGERVTLLLTNDLSTPGLSRFE